MVAIEQGECLMVLVKVNGAILQWNLWRGAHFPALATDRVSQERKTIDSVRPSVRGRPSIRLFPL